MGILKKILAERFVPFLPSLLDTTKPPAERQAKELSRAFSAFTLNKLFDVSPQIASASVVDDFNDKGIDAIYYESRSETLYLLQTKLKESEQFKQEDALPFCEGIRLLLKQNFTAFNANVQNLRVDIENALDVCSRIQLVIPYTGDGVSQTAMSALQSLLNDEDLGEERLVKNVIFYAADEIRKHLLAEQSYRPVNADINLCNSYKIEEPHTTYYGVARLTDLVFLHNEAGNHKDKDLYERNIRYFLGSGSSDVNKAIKNTLHEDPASFFYLNNGVTAVCEDIKPKGKTPTDGFRKFKVYGLSIINGAQTIASAAEFVAQNPSKDINVAKVMFTLIKAASDGGFGKRITKARNFQNPVQIANFGSLDDNQERLRQEIAHLGFEYLYRPEAINTVSDKIIKRDEALRSLALCQEDPRFVVLLKSDPLRLANPESEEYQLLFSTSLSGMMLINSVICSRFIRALVIENEQEAEELIMRQIYRHGIHILTAIMMKQLRNRINNTDLIDPKKFESLISSSFDSLRGKAIDQLFDPISKKFKSSESPLVFFKKMDRAIPLSISLMKEHYGLTHYQVETNPANLNKLAAEKKDLAHDLAVRLSRAAPQL